MSYTEYRFKKWLSKEGMLRTVLKAQREYLTKKSSQRLAWWSRTRWSSVITPKPSEKWLLWSYEENLPDIYLLNLTPEQLKTKVFSYWEKPVWKQWLLRLWTPISQQVEAWSYYQQCLAFREIQQNLSKSEPCLEIATHEQVLLENLAHWFVREEQRFQRTIENRSYRWLSKHFETKLHQHEKNRAEKFLKQLEKELAKLPSTHDQIAVQEKAQTSYQEVENVMHRFRCSWHYRYSPQIEQQAQFNSEEWHIISFSEVSTNPAHTPTISKENTIAPVEETTSLASYNSRTWFDTRRQTVNELLEQKESTMRDASIKALLEESLVTLVSFIEPQLTCYVDIVRQVYLRTVGPEIAMKTIEDIQPSLTKHCRQGALLFHPDRFQNLNTSLYFYWNEIFIRYKKFYDGVTNRLGNSQRELGNYLEKKQARKKEYENLMKKLDKLSTELEVFKKETDERFTEMEKKFAQDKLELETKAEEQEKELRAEMEAKARAREEKMDRLYQLIGHNFPSGTPTTYTPQPIETTESEERASSFSFKA